MYRTKFFKILFAVKFCEVSVIQNKPTQIWNAIFQIAKEHVVFVKYSRLMLTSGILICIVIIC